ncbi:transposable element Tcb2 transposase [Trichonephila clavipes]|nr:transposable element Tcb2 transposase [Trichonephila clavipes]
MFQNHRDIVLIDHCIAMITEGGKKADFNTNPNQKRDVKTTTLSMLQHTVSLHSIPDCNSCDTTRSRVRSTTPAEDRYIVLSAKGTGAPQLSRWQISFLLPQEKQISRKPVARRVRGEGLYARTPVVCVPLTRHHRTARLQWFREHHNWTEQDWACVLFSDESRFSLSSDCRRQLIWRESGTVYRPEKYPGKGPISDMQYHGVGRHHDQWPHAPTCGCNGTVTGQRYIDEVLLPHVRLFPGAVGDKFVFMDDNGTCH